ncbi:MAG: dockerin type I repeat-containing protein, partial [Oscillospiraceae bacterium]|nr:dockerin type I repeat-containing protein [Oscillospiraceae bacterium]
MKKIRKTLAGIIALSMLTSNSVYISAAEKSKSEDNSPSVISASKKDAPKLNERIKQLEDSGLSISEILDCLAADGTWGQVAVMFKVKPGAEIPKLKEYHYIQQYWEDDAYIIESLPEDLKEYVELDIVEKAEFWFPPTSGAAARAERAKEYRWLFKNGGYTEDTYIFLEFSDGFDINEVLLPDSEMYNTYTMANDVVYYIHASEEVMNQYIDWYENYEGEDLKAFFIDRPTVPVNETDDPAEPAVPVNNDKDNVKAGDIFADDKIDVTDLTELSLALLGDRNLSEDQKKAADVDGDGDVTLADLAMLRQYLSKKIDSLGKTPNASIPSPAVTSDITDISDSCETVTVGVDVDKWGSALKSIMISSM